MLEAPARSADARPVERLYIEASALLNRRLTGIGRLVARLVDALARRTSVRLTTMIQPELARSIRLRTSLLCGQELEVSRDRLPSVDADVDGWVRRVLGQPCRRHNAEQAQAHAGLYTMLRPMERHFGKEVCLLYDFTPVLLPWVHTRDTQESFGIFFSQAAACCDRAVAISGSTRADASWLCTLPTEHVDVGYPGPSLCVEQHACPDPVERRRNVILIVSTLEPRKNGRFLLEWFLNTRVLPSGMELWWVGPPGWLWDRFKRMRWHAQGRQVKFLGMVSDRRLCEAYRQAAFSVYPSLYEGFGFPVLDSLWHGTPVLSAYHSSLQELAAPGVGYFDPCDPATLDAAYLALERGPRTVIDRAELARKFSWTRFADTVLRQCA